MANSIIVEDIMDGQCIITQQFNFAVDPESNCLAVPTRKLWLQNVLIAFTNHLVQTLAAFLANSVQKIPLRVVRIRKMKKSQQLAIAQDPQNIAAIELEADETERCVECTVLHEPEGIAFADVIFVHGLHGGLDRTWTQGKWRVNNPKLQDLTPIRRQSTGNMYVPVRELSPPQECKLKRTLNKLYTNIPAKVARKNNHDQINTEQSDDEIEVVSGHEDFSSCWPKDWLPDDCPGVRVLGINYSTDKLWRPLWEKMKRRTNLTQRSKEMMEELLRLGVGNRPIIWVGHSKGGLYIKQMLLNSTRADMQNQTVKNLLELTKGIMFYSVPHKGSPVADLTFPFFKRSIEVLEIQTNCDFVLDLHTRFLEMLNKETSNAKPEIFSFIDTENTPIGLFASLKFIAYESADPDVGVKCEVPLDHRQICKPAGRDCFLYLELVKLINRTIFDKDL
ncbi:unnamed protein product [Ceutorhynchus assimilis]|uniref:Protein SERAC1 n=1 Tax=Ceutorhynchus assimilis TaxID=467358 RepID=A0A9N9QHH6_9CUCU|nr:unnamed protein product [Ceutorhynchus assimilis]